MAQIEKGTIASISENTAFVLTPSGIVTPGLIIPTGLRVGSPSRLIKGTDVLFVQFDDRTGMVICRADGN